MGSHARVTSTAVDIEAAPGRVWSVLADTEAYPGWSRHLRAEKRAFRAESAREAAGLGIGQAVRVRLGSRRKRPLTLRSTVLVAHAGYEARWIGRWPVPGLLSWEHAFDLTDGGDGTTRVVQTLAWRGVLAAVVTRGLRAADFEEDMEALGQALRSRVERGLLSA